MRILYLSLSYLPSRRASSVQVMKMSAALARLGHEVVLVAKRGEEAGVGDDHAFYAVAPSFVIDKLPRPQRRGGGLVYAGGLLATLARRRGKVDLVYCRDPIGALLAAEAGLPVVFEAHGVPRGWIGKALRRAIRSPRFRGVVAISEALRRDLETAGFAPATAPMVVAHDACDPPTRAFQPRPLGQPPRIGYVGGLYPGRGVETVVELARQLPQLRFVVVGGSEPDLARWRATGLPQNLELRGFVSQVELPAIYAELDVVLMPYARAGVVGPTGREDTSRWASPMKMFEYMASGAPIIASDLPVLGEVLRDGENALLVAADDVAAWRVAVERLLGDPALRTRLARQAQADLASQYTWDARARRVADCLFS